MKPHWYSVVIVSLKKCRIYYWIVGDGTNFRCWVLHFQIRDIPSGRNYYRTILCNGLYRCWAKLMLERMLERKCVGDTMILYLWILASGTNIQKMYTQCTVKLRRNLKKIAQLNCKLSVTNIEIGYILSAKPINYHQNQLVTNIHVAFAMVSKTTCTQRITDGNKIFWK